MAETPELVTPVIVQANDNLRLAEEVALGYLARFSGVTRVNYALGLRQWFAFCDEYTVPVLQARRAHIDMYMRHMEEIKKYARSTVCGKTNPVIGMYAYACEEGYIPVSPGQFVKRKWAERVSTTKHLTRTEMLAVLDLAEAAGPVDHAVVCLLGLNGLRVGELCAIQIEHFGSDRWHPTIFLPNRKNGRSQTLPLANRTAFAVREVMEARTEGQLFYTGRGNPMTRYQAGRIVKRLAKKAGIKKNISPHSFRHSFITLSLNAGATTREVQISAGHADERMTTYYDRGQESLARNTTHRVSSYIEGAE